MSGVCLTGDVHSMRLSNAEQGFLPEGRCELDLAMEYAELAAKNDIDVTFFVTGLAGLEQPDILKTLDAMQGVEIGGHTFRSLQPDVLHRFFRVLWNSRYGPGVYQRYDVQRTTSVLAERVTRPTSWRTHGYASDRRTPAILANQGYTVMSDRVVPSSEDVSRIDTGLLSVPVNTLRDHGHVYHANRTQEAIADAEAPGDPFDPNSYAPEDWFERIKEQVFEITGRGEVATIQAHPVCQYTADSFQTLQALMEWLGSADLQTYQARALPDILA